MTTDQMSDGQMSTADAAWLGMEQPENLMVVTGVLRFGERLDRARFAETLRERMVERYPTFRRRIVPATRAFGRPSWTDDADFDLDAHLVEAVLEPGSEPGSEQGSDGEQALAGLISELLSTPIDMSRSPWQFHLVDGPGDGSTVIARLHHCIADGIALAAVLLALADQPPGLETGDRVPAPKPRLRSRLAYLPRTVGSTAWFGGQMVRTGLRVLLAARDPRTRLHAELGRRKGVAWTSPLDLEAVKAVARATGVTVNDVLLSVSAGALRRHLVAHGEQPHDLRIFVPVDVRPADQPVPVSLGNWFGLVFVRLPLSVADPVQRLREVHLRMSQLKAGAEAAATFAMLRVVGALPSWGPRLAVGLLGAKSSAVVTHVRGPSERVVIAGSRLDRVMFWVPQAGSVGLGLSILSYAGSVTVGIAADRNVVPDPTAIADAVEEELADLIQSLGAARLDAESLE